MATGEMPGREAAPDHVEAGDSPAWWTADRSRLHRWLERSIPVLAPMYLGAGQMVFEEKFPGRVHFVSHAVREIGNRLPSAFAEVPKLSGPRPDFRHSLGRSLGRFKRPLIILSWPNSHPLTALAPS